MILAQGVGIVAFWILLPLLIGNTIRKILKIDKSFAANYIVGMLVMWAAFQLMAVPLILLKSPFRVLVALWFICMGILAMQECKSIWKHRFIWQKKEYKILLKGNRRNILVNILPLILMCILIGQQGYMYLRYMHTDADDSRFVVNAVDAYEQNTMLLTNPTTGEYVGTWIGDLNKDVAAPWSMYYAAVSKLCGIYPTVIAHTIMPVFLLLIAYMAYWLIGKRLFGNNIQNIGLFVTFVALLNTFFGPSVYTESVFLLTRVWQGKAVVAGVMFPVLLWCMMELYYNHEKQGAYLLLALANISTCLMSGMGILLGALFIGCFSLVYVICIRRWFMVWRLGLICVPNIVYGLVYVLA